MRVVNVKAEPCTHYVGRMSSFNAAKHGKFADLGNPFGMNQPWGKKNLRQAVIDSFEEWARSQPAVLERIKALPEDAVLGCWCKPAACHGDVIIKLWKEMHNVQAR